MRPCALLIVALVACLGLRGQTAPPADDSANAGSFTWPDRFWISGQFNSITQYQPAFHADYSGPNSLTPESDLASSRVATLYTGLRLTPTTDFIFDLESAGGGGLSNALGVAGFTNLDVVRNPSLSQLPYTARVMIHQIIPLSHEYIDAAKGPLALATRVPMRRLEIRLGKMSTVDFFDLNGVGSDSHLQFMNWTADNNGAYDYAADTRGYTYGLVLEYYDKNWAARFGEMLMPTVANGIKLDWDLARARGENFEVEFHPSTFPKRQSTVRLLSFVNHANMGDYREAIDGYISGKNPVPDIIDYRQQGRVKYGFGINLEQELTANWRAYARLGWNDGRTESFAYTEVDRELALGTDLRGKAWRRRYDKAGVTFIINGITGDHRRYLALGGLGFLLGDGALQYGHEQILEAYYNAHLWRGIYMAADLQHIWNPGYNQDRGPVTVASFRFHFEDSVPFTKE
ncbi:MAG: carbohydrate porin [Bryobacteraceae bacterium]